MKSLMEGFGFTIFRTSKAKQNPIRFVSFSDS